MKYIDFKKAVMEHLTNYRLNTLGCTEQGIYKRNGQAYGHILPENLKELNFLPGVKYQEDIKMHMFANHLNSSQVMCINFFAPIIEDNKLLEMIKNITNVKLSKNAKIEKAEFEFIGFIKEFTNFDFYVELSTKEKFYFEIKYTESEFGKASLTTAENKMKYESKFEDIYKDWLKDSLYLKELSKDELYKHYQLHRNISYIKSEKDYVILIYPSENENLTKELHEVLQNNKCDNVKPIFWCDICEMAKINCRNTNLYLHYKMFQEKYLQF